MRNSIVILSTVVAILLFPKCSTMDVEAVQKMDNVSVALIGVNKHIDMGGYNDLAGLVQRIAEDEAFDLDPVVDKLHKKTFGEYEKFLPFNLMPEEKVIGADRYKTFTLFEKEKREERFKNWAFIKTPEGYKEYDPNALNDKERKKMLDEGLPSNTDGGMFMYVDYVLVKHDIPMLPVSKAGVKARVRIEVIDAEGEQVMKIRKSAESDEKIKAVVGVMKDVSKIQSMCENATEKAMDEVELFIKEELAEA